MRVAVAVHDLSKEYVLGDNVVRALAGVSLSIDRGRFVAIMGPSGSGKSTLLHCIARLERPTSGQIEVGDTDIADLSEEAAAAFRRRHIGVVFQFFNLLGDLTVEENVAVPLMLDGIGRREIHERVRTALAGVDLEHRRNHRPGELSGGEMQRAAIARALVIEPAMILADEPTGNLDSESGALVLQTLRKLCDDFGRTVLMATHDDGAAATADRVVRLRDGVVDGEPGAR
jgi:putative ABC transport system ATP-binding protein